MAATDTTLLPTTSTPETAVNSAEPAAGLSSAELITDKEEVIRKAQEQLNAIGKTINRD